MRRQHLHPVVKFVLGDAFLGFLAIVAAALTMIPMLFKTPPATEAAMEVAQWLIVLLFAIEYATSLAAARSKREFVLNPWRLIDAATILIPLLTFIPGVSRYFRSSTLLRLIRLARVVALGARASGIVVREEKAAAVTREAAPMQVRMLPGSGATAPRQATWEEFVRWAKQPGAQWYSIANVDRHNLKPLADATGISEAFLAAHLLGTGYPHVEASDQYVSVFVWLPEEVAGKPVERNGLLLLASDKSVVTFSHRPAHLMEKVVQPVGEDLSGYSFPVQMVCRFLKAVLDADEALVGRFEEGLRELEDLPVRESRPQFFERTFRLKKELSSAQADLWRLRGVLKELGEGRARLPGNNPGPVPFLQDLSEQADYLYETVNNVREGVLSLIELHLNVVSFEMNRVMRVLAVVSVLGLIPAVVGGLFGMNLSDNPWPFTLPQVTFAVAMGMITCLYFFLVKGWLR